MARPIPRDAPVTSATSAFELQHAHPRPSVGRGAGGASDLPIVSVGSLPWSQPQDPDHQAQELRRSHAKPGSLACQSYLSWDVRSITSRPSLLMPTCAELLITIRTTPLSDASILQIKLFVV